MEIYLDHAATTYVDERVKESMDKYFSDEYGNPGSFNTVGLRAKNAMDESRETISKILNCTPQEIIFTGSGTESINLAIKGFVRANKSKGNHIITQKTEHEAVLETCHYLEKEEGLKVTYLDVDEFGLIKLDELEKEITKETILVSIMYANNEIGTVQNIKEISEICKKHKIKFHTDACQAAGYLDINVQNLGIDLMSLNGSKLYGPKGIGLLYVKKGTMLKPIIHGGGQEFGLRSGTENIPYIVGFAKALEIAQREKDVEVMRLINLRDYLINNVLENIPKTFLNGHPSSRLPNNANITFLDVEGEAIMLMMNEYGICASSGSACTSKSLDPSHVILAIGLPYEAAHGSIRFTLGKKTTKEGIDKLLKVLPGIIEYLRQVSPVNLSLKDMGK
ncbi:IscS subfamily cysteine desulfurase [Candidatus Woesearchaeota archaeon]|nr:IscS subfamily cysteine desulfurase [Candidatus Woesearchaeota archaeon]